MSLAAANVSAVLPLLMLLSGDLWAILNAQLNWCLSPWSVKTTWQTDNNNGSVGVISGDRLPLPH